MTKIWVISVGHKLETFEKQWIGVFEKRLKRYVQLEWIALDPKKVSTYALLVQAIESKIPKDAQIFLLDERGKQKTTKQWKDWFDQQEIKSQNKVAFVFGESYGFSQDFKQRFPNLVSLSSLTFSHRIALLVWFEQLYRIFSWKAGSPYHHE